MSLSISPRTLVTFGLAAGLMLVLADPALAQTTTTSGTSLSTLAQNVLDLLNNNFVRVIGVLAIMGVGFACMAGRFDIHRAVIVVLGIIVTFGAATVYGLVTGSSS